MCVATTVTGQKESVYSMVLNDAGTTHHYIIALCMCVCVCSYDSDWPEGECVQHGVE